MPTEITQVVNERSTAVFKVSFTDESGAPVVPKSAVWSLVDVDSNIINSREKVVIASAAEVNIVLSDDDLQIIDPTKAYEYRWLVVEAVYTSIYGTDLTLKDEIKFKVCNLHYIT